MFGGAPNVVAHLSASGALCFANNADVVLDRYNVGGTALLCIEMARRGVERALTHKYVEDEIAAEFPQHWQGDVFFYDLGVDWQGRASLFPLARANGRCPVLAADKSALNALSGDAKAIAKTIDGAWSAQVYRASEFLSFGQKQKPPQTLTEFLDWFERSVPGQRDAALDTMVNDYPDLTAIFVVAKNGCVGISVDLPLKLREGLQRRQGLRHYLSHNDIAVTRYSGTRIDEHFLYGRNMIEAPLLKKRIALIGCGAIGGHLAKLLLHTGAGHGGGTLLLLDTEVLAPGNVGRHFLGPTHIGEFKALAVREELLRMFPDAVVQATTEEAITYFSNLWGYDLLIDATGEEALSIAINARLVGRRLQSSDSPDALYVRLFGNGAAAQALMVDGSKNACFKCLRPDMSQPARYDPMRPDAPIIQQVATCGEGLFTPYAISAPGIAAALALQSVLDWNSGKAQYHLRTARIDHDSTVDVAPKNPPRSKQCPSCAALAQVV